MRCGWVQGENRRDSRDRVVNRECKREGIEVRGFQGEQEQLRSSDHMWLERAVKLRILLNSLGCEIKKEARYSENQ